jgi:hypothetical protein
MIDAAAIHAVLAPVLRGAGERVDNMVRRIIFRRSLFQLVVDSSRAIDQRHSQVSSTEVDCKN